MAVIMGTAGHIDHGKTSLVRALTGIDCDRLEEEKRRGITIELGFAYVTLPNGERMGVVDVPGHERFVRNMVAGAAGIDFVLLVIAADEGVMPQTREHLEICSLLGIRHGMVALTKIDMVDPELLELAQEDVASFLEGTFLEGAPSFPVSSVSGEGMDALRQAIYARNKELAPKRREDLFRLPVDRVFTLKGHGTVVTGTLISGRAKPGEDVELLPSRALSRIRGIQTHGADVEEATPGHRTSINLAGLDVEDIRRGDVIARPGTLFPSSRWVLSLTCLSSSPRALRHRSEIHFHHGAKEVPARLYFYDRDKLAPGERALAEVRFSPENGEETFMAGVFGDRCVVRAFSPLRTVAGGSVLIPLDSAPRRRDISPEMRETLLALPDRSGQAGEEDRLVTQLELAGPHGATQAALSVLTNLENKRLEKLVQTLSGKGRIACYDKESRAWIAAAALQKLSDAALARAAEFHRREPLKPGMAKGVLMPAQVPPKLAHFVLEKLLRSGALTAEGEQLRLADHRISLASDQSALREKLVEAHRAAPMTPPNLKDVLEELGVTLKEAAPVLRLLQQEGTLIKVSEGLWYDSAAIEELKHRTRVWFETHDDLTPGDFKEVTGGLTRKYLIPLLEYFDRERFTMRVGDKRQIRGRVS